MKFPPYVQRGLIALVVLLLLVSAARLLVTMHQQDERIAILEAQVEALLADTSRLQISSFYSSNPSGTNYKRRYSEGNHTHYKYSNKRYTRDSYPSEEDSASDSSHSSIYSSSRSSSFAESSEDRPRKFTEPHLFDLNTIDSLMLIRIPGIASRTASVILKHRQLYGGFYDANQLRDFLTWDAAIDYLDEWCSLWFTANADRVSKLSINTATISQLQRHPYLSHEQAVEISQYRMRHKGFRQASELQMLSTLSSEDISRLLPYLSFD